MNLFPLSNSFLNFSKLDAPGEKIITFLFFISILTASLTHSSKESNIVKLLNFNSLNSFIILSVAEPDNKIEFFIPVFFISFAKFL